MPKTDLERAYLALTEKQVRYTTLFEYYDGLHPLRYTSERLREVFGDREARFSQNWAAVVIDSELERIRLKEFTVAKQEQLTQTLNDLFVDTELKLDADDVHKAALVCGEAFVFVWKDDETNAVEAYYNDPRLCHVFYDPHKPRVKQFAVKWWVDETDDKRYLNLYYPERIEYYVSKSKAENVQSWKNFVEAEPNAENPFGIVPIFHFRPDRRKIKSELTNVIEPQDAINKLMADMMIAAEFGAFKQRWIVTNADITTLKNSPNEIWTVPAGDGEGENTQVGEFNPTELDNYLKAMERIANNIAIISRTPKHYVFSQGGDPSGEALIAMEAPLNKKTQTHIDRFEPAWAQVAAFVLQLSGAAEIKERDITPTFERPETVQPMTAAQIRQTNVASGIPLNTTLKREGWTEAEIEDMEAEPPDSKQLVSLVSEVKDDLDPQTFIETIAPAFNWDETQVAEIVARILEKQERDVRNAVRGLADSQFGEDDDDDQETAEADAA